MSVSLLLRGASAIGEHLGINAGQAAHLDRVRRIPTFRLPGDSAPHSTAEALDSWLLLGAAYPGPSGKEEQDPLLGTLAGVFVERWLAHGGWLTVSPALDGVSMGMRVGRDALWRSSNPHGQRLWHDGWKVGRWRALSELVSLMPGLEAAIVDHIVAHGERGKDGSHAMTRSAAEMGVV